MEWLTFCLSRYLCVWGGGMRAWVFVAVFPLYSVGGQMQYFNFLNLFSDETAQTYTQQIS